MTAAECTPVDTSPAGTLRCAAAKLRLLSDAAVPGPWAAGRDDAHGWTVGLSPHNPAVGVARIPNCAGAGGDARYIAAMHPGIGAALAAWLEAVSARVDQMTYREWRDGVEPEAVAVAYAVLGEQR